MIKIDRIVLLFTFVILSTNLLYSDTLNLDRIYKVQGDQNYPPYEFINENNQPDGYNIDLFNEIAKSVGLKYEIELAPWSEVRKNIQEGNTDILTGMYFSEYRLEEVDFSNPYIIVYQSIFSRKDNPVNHLENLRDKTILVQKDDIMHDFILESELTTKIIPVSDPHEALRILNNGDFDAALLARVQGLFYIDKFDLNNIYTSKIMLKPQRYCFAVKKGDLELLALLDEGLSIIKANGRFREIRNKWFGPYEKDTFWSVYWIYPTGLALIILVAFVIVVILRTEVAKKTKYLTEQVEITKIAESKLQQSNKMYELIVNNSSDFIFQILLEDMSYKFVSPSSKKVTGYSPSFFYNNNDFFQTIIHPEDKIMLKNLFKKFREGNPPDECEFKIIDPSGVTRWLYQKNRLIEGINGHVSILSNIKDISIERMKQSQLKSSIEYWETTFNAINFGICLINSDGLILNSNNNFTHLAQRNKEHIINKRVNDVLNLQNSKITELISTARKTKTKISMVLEETDSWFLVTIYPANRDNVFMGYFVFTIENITEIKKSELQLRLIKKSLDHSNEEAFWIDRNGNIIYLNTTAMNNLGYNREELQNKFVSIIDPNINKNKWSEFWDRLRKEKHLYISSTHITKSGSSYPVDIFSNYFEYQGEEYGFIFCRNKTEKQNREIQMNSLFEALDNSLNGFIVFNKSRRVIYANPAFLKLFGFKDFNHIPENSIPDSVFTNADILNLIEKLKTKSKVEFYSKFTRDNGDVIDCRFSFFSYRSSDSISYIAGSVIDITNTLIAEKKMKEYYQKLENEFRAKEHELDNRKEQLIRTQQALTFLVEDANQVSDNLVKSNKKLMFVNEELESFTYTVSHDLRAPLRAIRGFSTILINDHSDQLNDEAKRLVNILNSSAEKMSILLEELLKFSRVGRHHLSKNKIDLNLMIKQLAKELKGQHKNRSITFDIQENIPDVSGDFSLFKQVFTNLLDNAIKFSKHNKESHITVSHSSDNRYATLAIKDNGIGFNDKYSEKIFEVFQRLHSDEEFYGTGAGLAIVKRIIARHNGRVWAESTLGDGATFYIKLPLKETE